VDPGERPLNPNLSFRELQVVALVTEGHANKEIAARLILSEGTIKVYMNRIFHKTGATNRTQVAVRAVRESLVSYPLRTQPGP
jgi:DNA-binding NarL/FixJ family response regulator